MSPDALRSLTLLHGIVSWLEALLLVTLCALLFRKGGLDKPFSWRLPVSATFGAITSFASGMGLELHYRVHLRQRLFITSKTLGWLFERKLHLSFGLFMFATIGLLALFLARKDPRFFSAMRHAYGLATACALITCVISTIVRIARPLGD